MYLPDLVLDLVFSHLDARSVATAACVNTSFRTAANRAPLRLAITADTDDTFMTWMSANTRNTRVVSAAVRRSAVLTVTPAFESLRRLRFMFCRVPAQALTTFPNALETLHVHQLVPGHWPMHGRAAVFSTGRVLGLFPRLLVARITFRGTPGQSEWRRVLVDGGPLTLRVLELRQCPDIFVVGMPPLVRDLSLSSVEGMYFFSESVYPAETMSTVWLECGMNLVVQPNVVPPAATRFVLISPRADMTKSLWQAIVQTKGLSQLVLHMGVVILDGPPPTIDTFRLHADHLVIRDTPQAVGGWNAIRHISAVVHGVPLDPAFFTFVST